MKSKRLFISILAASTLTVASIAHAQTGSRVITVTTTNSTGLAGQTNLTQAIQMLQDGDRIAFVSDRNGDQEVYLMDPDGSLDPANGGALSGDEFKGRIGSLGLYSYATYKWHRQWSAGFLFDWVQNPQNHNDETFGYSPYITWALSHWT